MTSKISTLSRRGFNRRLNLTVAVPKQPCNLTALTREVDKLVDETYEVFNEIDEKTFHIIEGPLNLLLSTLNDLLSEFRLAYPEALDSQEVLGGSISSLEELKQDIINFRIQVPNDENLKQLLSKAVPPK
ncbi:MAG: hypothetical protein LIO90_04330 [Bacteroidales bacterium]|nr:hypothetical protein [Bacteroidales bacterium]